jgi:hypothetical protein
MEAPERWSAAFAVQKDCDDRSSACLTSFPCFSSFSFPFVAVTVAIVILPRLGRFYGRPRLYVVAVAPRFEPVS